MPLEGKGERLIFSRIDPTGPGLIDNYSDDAGKDILTSIDFILESKGFMMIPTNVKILLPKNTYGQIAEKSSLAKKGIGILGGVIDAGYCGELKVILFNLSEKKISFSKGDRIAQIICKNIVIPKIKEVSEEELEQLHKDSERKEKGFGSLSNATPISSVANSLDS